FVTLLPGPGHHPGRDAVLGRLTDRERAVFARLAAGRSNREIAGELHLSQGTVKVHVGRILAKLHLRDRVPAVVLAYESGLIKPATPGPPAPGAPSRLLPRPGASYAARAVTGRPCGIPGPPGSGRPADAPPRGRFLPLVAPG